MRLENIFKKNLCSVMGIKKAFQEILKGLKNF